MNGEEISRPGLLPGCRGGQCLRGTHGGPAHGIRAVDGHGALALFNRFGAGSSCGGGTGRPNGATNVIDAPEAAVITQLGLEHTRELGGHTPPDRRGEGAASLARLRRRPLPSGSLRRSSGSGDVRAPGRTSLVDTRGGPQRAAAWDGQVLDYRERRGHPTGAAVAVTGREECRFAALDTVDVLNARVILHPETGCPPGTGRRILARTLLPAAAGSLGHWTLITQTARQDWRSSLRRFAPRQRSPL